jgi:deoxyadenosine/deoxycytidine kinase
MQKPGILIAGVGLPAAGKSTILRVLAEKKGWQRFVEPEEMFWPQSVKRHEMAGIFTALSWFRAMRVSNLYAADTSRQQGNISIVDCYYDKLMTYYLTQPHMEWLVSPHDPYFETLKSMAIVDQRQLPQADIIVMLTVSFETWKQLIMKRHRQLDMDRVFPHAFPFQSYLLQAVQMECAHSGSHLITCENCFGAIEQVVEKLDLLVSAYI